MNKLTHTRIMVYIFLQLTLMSAYQALAGSHLHSATTNNKLMEHSIMVYLIC